MGEILNGAALLELNPPRVERGDLRIEGGRIAGRGRDIAPVPGDTVTDLTGRVVMPGLVVAHTHLSQSLARGMPAPKQPPRGFVQTLEQTLWKYERELDESAVEIAAMVGAAEALRCGVTTVLDQHASPGFVEGSLHAIRRAVDLLGLRAVLSYSVTDRHGKESREASLRESEYFLSRGQIPRCKAMVGGEASFTLETETLAALEGLARKHETGVHLHVAEDRADEHESRRLYDKGAVERLSEAGLLGPKAVLAHCTCLSWEELSMAQQTGSWLVHNPRSNMLNGVGYAPANRFGPRRALGTDGLSHDLLAEASVAHLRALDAGGSLDPLRWLTGGHTLASDLFGAPLGTLAEGALADLVVLDYAPATPVAADNLATHVFHGLRADHVDAVMVDGLWRVWAREILSVDGRDLHSRARQCARALWSRMQER